LIDSFIFFHGHTSEYVGVKEVVRLARAKPKPPLATSILQSQAPKCPRKDGRDLRHLANHLEYQINQSIVNSKERKLKKTEKSRTHKRVSQESTAMEFA
jgi:hypothetical protein